MENQANSILGDLEPQALRDMAAMAVQRPQEIGSCRDRGGKPDPDRAGRMSRRDPRDGLGEPLSAGIVDQHNGSSVRQIAVGRRNYLIFKFYKTND